MLIRLKRHNVIKEVDNQHKADKMIREGFSLVSQPVLKKVVKPVAKPSEGSKKKKKVTKAKE